MAERKRIPRGLLDPESQAIEEAVEAAPRVPASLAALGRGFYEANIAPLLSPVQTARGLLAVGREFVRDPRGTAGAVAQAEGERLRQASQRPESAFEYYGGLLSPFSMLRRAPTMAELDVYHGTPHRFPATEANPLGEFDASKIGTGEGAQAYGHGVYLAESPKVAEDYRRSTSRSRFLTNDGFFDPSELEHLNVKVKARHGNIDEAIETARKYGVPDEDYPEVAAKAARDLQKLEALKARGGYRENPGVTYKADLPDEMIDRMLDWDKRIIDQPESIQTAWKNWQQTKEGQKIKKQLLARGNTPAEIEKMFANPTGETMHGWIYEGYGSSKGGERPKVAKFLKAQGVLGVKYQDAGSRTQSGTGTRNFVVFPGEEKKVRILERK